MRRIRAFRMTIEEPGAAVAGTNVIVTGGANGIGTALVRKFHQQGATVFFCDRDVRSGRKLAAELGPRAVFQSLDLTRETDIVRWLSQVRRRAKRIHALVNNAARDPRIDLGDTTARDWDALFATNLRAYFLMCREAVRAMGAGGAIINLASITFHAGPAGMTAYVATKGGVLGFTRSLARELGPKGIRVNTVSPGWVMTTRQLREYVTPAVKKLIRRSQALPGLIQPEEIADVVLFLASPASRAITGQELLVDRGWYHS
jgi:NAD(P)-dependent dehydrogenase (short-subunit alcohol dehydrogenase family)